MRAKLIGAIGVALAMVGSAAVADTISNLEVHYAFEDDANYGANSVGLDGVPCG
ncbi:MAG: hypothetical protein HQ567_18965 [Candidatus Nealsonbacteria bacterium]|nr:hypothetical protein [Candidatus Nealsonbacteria bacterium]